MNPEANSGRNNPKLWEFLEAEQRWGKETKALYEWSLNHENCEPFRKFLDLIGYSEDVIGSISGDWKKPSQFLGFMELDYLADALKEYANNPSEVERFIDELLELEIGE